MSIIGEGFAEKNCNIAWSTSDIVSPCAIYHRTYHSDRPGTWITQTRPIGTTARSPKRPAKTRSVMSVMIIHDRSNNMRIEFVETLMNFGGWIIKGERTCFDQEPAELKLTFHNPIKHLEKTGPCTDRSNSIEWVCSVRSTLYRNLSGRHPAGVFIL